jgi:curli biogenesis system outer membrane secretion channel CsgG
MEQISSVRRLIGASFVGLVLTGCASSHATPTGWATAVPTPAAAVAAPKEPAPLMTTGPKKRIAVAKFDANGAFLSAYGGWDIGGGLAAQLATALAASGQFIVVERAELSSVLREQELGLQKIVSKDTAAQPGQMLGAQLLVRGSVTEFEQRAGGGGLRVGVGTGVLGGTIGAQTTTGVVGIDLRLIDTTTGQVVQSLRAEAKLDQRGLTGDINVRQVSFGGDTFDRTVLGQATRQAIERAVGQIRSSAQLVPWTGRVVEVVGDDVYVNAGSAAGIKAGDVFTISTVLRELTDPATGTRLGVVEQKVGTVTVVAAQDNFSVAKMLTPFETQRGDFVKMSAR